MTKFRIYFVLLLLTMLAGCKESNSPKALLVLPDGQTEVVKTVEKILKEDPNVVKSALGSDFRIKIIEPDESVDHKIVIIKPDPEVDYKIIVIDPGSGYPMPAISKRLEDEIRKHLDSRKRP
jgi:hypothetical protein